MSHILIASLMSMVIAQMIKVPIYYYKKKQFKPGMMFSTGSMPSSHTAFVVTMVITTGYLEGVQLITSSGYARLDNEAVRAINAAAPFAPFPASWGGLEKLNIRATFEYTGRRIF